MSDENPTQRSTESNANRSGRGAAGTRRSFLKATAATSLLPLASAQGVGAQVERGIPTPWLERDGNALRDPEGNKVVLRGVNVIDPARAGGVTDDIAAATDEERWHARVIRLPMQPQDISPHGGGGGEPEPVSFSQADLEQYLDRWVDPAVEQCRQENVYVILDYHRHWPVEEGGIEWTHPNLSEEVELFWETVAPRYAEDSHVLFEVYNEPHEPYHAGDIADPEAEQYWDQWRERAQPWVDTIREHAPRNPIIVGSPRWSQYTYWASEGQEFEGDNLLYTAHIYAQDHARPLDRYFGEPSEDVPVFMTEFGFDPHSGEDYLQGSRDVEGRQFSELYAEYDSMHWTAWCFHDTWAPPMLGGGYEPANEWGEWVQDHLYEYRDEDLPLSDDGSGVEPPADLRVTGTSTSSIDLSWDGVDAAEEYAVYVDGALDDRTGATSATVSGLAADASYEIGVAAVGADGDESDRATVEATTERGERPTLAVDLARSEVETDGRVDATLTLSEAPRGVSGYTVTVEVADPSIATIEDAGYADAFALSEAPEFAEDGSAVTLKGVDLNDEIEPGAADVELATVTLAAERAGRTSIGVAVEMFDSDDDGADVDPAVAAGALSVRELRLDPIEGSVPQDVDGDGIHEDVNASGELDSDDVVLFFEYFDEPEIQDHPEAYDVNGSGELDFDDVATLFDQL